MGDELEQQFTVYFAPTFHTGANKRGTIGRPARATGAVLGPTGVECTVDGVRMLVPWHNIMRVEYG